MSSKHDLMQPLISDTEIVDDNQLEEGYEYHSHSDHKKFSKNFDEIDITVPSKSKGFIAIKSGITYLNVSNLFVSYFVSIGQVVFFDLTLVYLLKSVDYYNIPQNKIADVTANII